VHRSLAHSDGNHAVYIDSMYVCMYVCVIYIYIYIYLSLGLIAAAETMLSLELQ